MRAASPSTREVREKHAHSRPKPDMDDHQPFPRHHEWQRIEDRLQRPAAATERKPHTRTRASKMRFPSSRRNVTPGRLASTASRTPSRGSLPFSETRCADRCVTACLTATFRSQGFPPSQRFGPRTSLRLYFTPLPLVGFWTSRAFPASASRSASRHPLLSCHWTHTHSRAFAMCEHIISGTKGACTLTSEPCSDLASDTPPDRKPAD